MKKVSESFERLVDIMDELREKCPWDRKQTIQTLRAMTIEETYELADAITNEDWKNLKEELGDLLLHITFYAKIATEQNKFTLEEVIDGICDKLIVRHPHIYGDVKVNDEEDVKRNWEAIKIKEGKKGLFLIPFCNNLECEKSIKNRVVSYSIRCLLINNKTSQSECLFCLSPTLTYAYLGRSH